MARDMMSTEYPSYGCQDSDTDVTMSDDDDEVVRTIDVHISTVEDGEFHLLQFPLRPVYRPYGDGGKIQGAYIKPSQKSLKMEYSVNKDPSCFDYSSEHADQMTHSLVSKGTSQPKADSKVKQTSESQGLTYALGILQGDNLVLSPISNIAQLRPDFSSLDRARTATPNPTQEQPKFIASEDEEEEQEQVVQVEFKKHQKGVTLRRETFAKIREKEDAEPWKRLTTLMEDSAEAYELFSVLLESAEKAEGKVDGDSSSDNGVEAIEFNGSQHQYLASLSQSNIEHETPIASISPAMLARLSLEEQVVKILCETQIIRYQRLVSYLTKKMEPEVLFQYLVKYAYLVRGNWVVKSNLISHGYLSLCRELIILLLAQKHGVGVAINRIASAIQLSHDQVTELLIPLANSENDVWTFKAQEDTHFIQTFPTLVAQQEQLLETLRPQILSQLVMLQKQQAQKSNNESQAQQTNNNANTEK